MLPKGTRLEGNVSLVQPGSKFRDVRLGIRFHTIVLADGLRVPIQTETLYVTASRRRIDGDKVGTGTAAWSDSRWAMAGRRGAIIGAGVGAAGGTAAVLTGDTKEVVLEAAHRSRCGSPDLSRHDRAGSIEPLIDLVLAVFASSKG